MLHPYVLEGRARSARAGGRSPQGGFPIETVEYDEIVFWDQQVEAMEIPILLTRFQEIQSDQPIMGVFLLMMNEILADKTAFTAFLKFMFVAWRCLEGSDSRVRTSTVDPECLKKKIETRLRMLIYLADEEDPDEIHSVLSRHTLEHHQKNIVLYVLGRILEEGEAALPVSLKTKQITAACVCALIDTFDEQIV